MKSFVKLENFLIGSMALINLIDFAKIRKDIDNNPSWLTAIALIIGTTVFTCVGITYLFVEKLNDNQIKNKDSSIETLEKKKQSLEEEIKTLKNLKNKTPNALIKKEKHSFSPFHKYFNFVKGYSGVDFWIPTAQKDISQFQSIKLYIIFDKPNTSFELCIYDGADDYSCEEINYQMGMKNNINSNERIISLPLKKFSVERSDIKKITFHVQKDNKKQEDNGFSVTKVDFE